MDELATYIVRYAPGENANRVLNIEITNAGSGQADSAAEAISSQLELALRRHFLKNQLYSEQIDDFSVNISGSYRSIVDRLELNLNIGFENADTGEEQGFERSVRFEYSGEAEKRRVLILNIDSGELSPSLIEQFSSDFRNEVDKRELYIQEKRPFQSVTIDCRTAVCLGAIGKKLDVKYIMLPRFIKTDHLKYVLSANLVDVKDRKSITKVSVIHAGSVAFLKGSLDDLVTRLALQENLQTVIDSGIRQETGHLSITSNPVGADIYLDDERLREVTNTLLEDVPAGMHSVSIRRGSLQRTLKIVLEAGETKHLHADLKPFEVLSLKLEKDPADPLMTGFKVEYSLPVDPASVNQKTFFVQRGNRKIAGSHEVVDNKVVFRPAKPLHHGKLYKIIATRSVLSIYGDAPDLVYERRYRTTPYPTEKDTDVLIYSESHGPETWSKYKRGILKLGVSSFTPLKHFDINGQRIPLTDQTIFEFEVPFDFEKSGRKRLSYLITALTEEGRAQKRFVIHLGRKPKPKVSPFQLVTMLKVTNTDNLYSTSDDIENVSATKTTLTLVPIYKFYKGKRSQWSLKSILLRDKMEKEEYQEKEISFSQLALEWRLAKTFLGTMKTTLGYNDISMANANVFAGEEQTKTEMFLNYGFVIKMGKSSSWDLEFNLKSQQTPEAADEDDDTNGTVTGMTTNLKFPLIGAENRIRLKYKDINTRGKYKGNLVTNGQLKQDFKLGNWKLTWSYGVTDTAYKEEDPRLSADGIAVKNTASTAALKLGYNLFKSTRIDLEMKNKKQESNIQSYNYAANSSSLGLMIQF